MKDEAALQKLAEQLALIVQPRGALRQVQDVPVQTGCGGADPGPGVQRRTQER
jgi:hypothetical protein